MGKSKKPQQKASERAYNSRYGGPLSFFPKREHEKLLNKMTFGKPR